MIRIQAIPVNGGKAGMIPGERGVSSPAARERKAGIDAAVLLRTLRFQTVIRIHRCHADGFRFIGAEPVIEYHIAQCLDAGQAKMPDSGYVFMDRAVFGADRSFPGSSFPPSIFPQAFMAMTAMMVITI